jgi:hypothetical protein
VRVLPWHVTVSLDEYLNYERSRKVVRDTLGARAERYFEELERRLRDMLGERPHLPLSYVQYLYLARKPLK